MKTIIFKVRGARRTPLKWSYTGRAFKARAKGKEKDKDKDKEREREKDKIVVS